MNPAPPVMSMLRFGLLSNVSNGDLSLDCYGCVHMRLKRSMPLQLGSKPVEILISQSGGRSRGILAADAGKVKQLIGGLCAFFKDDFYA